MGGGGLHPLFNSPLPRARISEEEEKMGANVYTYVEVETPSKRKIKLDERDYLPQMFRGEDVAEIPNEVLSELWSRTSSACHSIVKVGDEGVIGGYRYTIIGKNRVVYTLGRGLPDKLGSRHYADYPDDDPRWKPPKDDWVL